MYCDNVVIIIFTYLAVCICLNWAIFVNASSNKNTASFINKLMNLKNNGGDAASILFSASLAKYLKKMYFNNKYLDKIIILS